VITDSGVHRIDLKQAEIKRNMFDFERQEVEKAP